MAGSGVTGTVRHVAWTPQAHASPLLAGHPSSAYSVSGFPAHNVTFMELVV